MPYLIIFGPQFYKLFSYLKSNSQVNQTAKLCKYNKISNLGSKTPNLGVSRPIFEKTILIFEISTLEFVSM